MDKEREVFVRQGCRLETESGESMTLQEQFEQAKAQLKEIVAGRPKVYRAWEDTWTAFHEDSTAYNKAHARLLEYDIAKNKVWDEVIRLRALVEEKT
jgi:hypothetical protein